MNKALITIVIIVILGLGGYFLLNKSKSSLETSTTMQDTNTQPTAENAFASIKDALAKSISLECDYPDPSNPDLVTKTYIKGGQVRVESTTTKAGSNVIMRDEKIYTWINGQKEGSLIDLNSEFMKEAKETVNQSISQSPNKRDELINQMEQYKDRCKPASIDDSKFAIPAGIRFVDLESQMKESGIDPKQMQKMMQQYQNTTPPPLPNQ